MSEDDRSQTMKKTNVNALRNALYFHFNEMYYNILLESQSSIVTLITSTQVGIL